MDLGRLCQIILKSDKEISGYGQLAQHAIFAYHMVRQTPLIALPPLCFPGWGLSVARCVSALRGVLWAFADRAFWSASFARLLFNSHKYHVYSVETNTIFLTQLQNLETL